MSNQRTDLKKIGSQDRHTFTGRFERLGIKEYKDKYSPTILLCNVKNDNEIVTDHLWFNYGKNFLKLGKLVKGDILQFDGRVGEYIKGYKHYLNDYKIKNPTNVKLLSNAHHFKPLPVSKDAVIGMIIEDNMDWYYKISKKEFHNYDEYFAKELGIQDLHQKDHYLSEWDQWKGNFWK